jgi:DeoR/GlpR family transcriptional regulator of sugar metabolism
MASRPAGRPPAPEGATAEARRARILEEIRTMGGASVAELARRHGVSQVTVHRDLEHLAAGGQVVRFHGGARAADGPPSARPETAWDRRLQQAGDEKDAIAAHARTLVEDGATIFLDASSTAYALANRIDLEPAEDLTIVTTSPAVALGMDAPGVRVIVAPGEVDLRMRAIGDAWTVEFLRRIKLDVAFMSGAGFDLERGLTTSRRSLADALAAVRASADRTVALLDASKVGRSAMLSIAPPDAFDAVVVDGGLPDEELERYVDAGVRLVRAAGLPDDDDAA